MGRLLGSRGVATHPVPAPIKFLPTQASRIRSIFLLFATSAAPSLRRAPSEQTYFPKAIPQGRDFFCAFVNLVVRGEPGSVHAGPCLVPSSKLCGTSREGRASFSSLLFEFKVEKKGS